ncbi:MAG: hypothetical protein AB7F22_29600 [Reyranella sp.]|uniref:hypothetical protein n=1 Tax=Reyranella sp. TaxID=1929291 RepID=UPI003D100896
MLQNLSVVRWLDGIEPAWTLLDQSSYEALRLHSQPPGGPIRLASDFSPDEIVHSPVARNTLILLHSASAAPGLKMTATGNLTRNVVAEMCDLFSWPGFDKTTAFRFHKVINEPDFLPLHFVRSLAQAAGLVRRHRGFLSTSRSRHAVLEGAGRRALQAIPFHMRSAPAPPGSLSEPQRRQRAAASEVLRCSGRPVTGHATGVESPALRTEPAGCA